jgi:hypothetical protein
VISRRRFLRTTLLGGALLGGAAIVGRHLTGYRLDPAIASKLRCLSAKEFLIFEAIARRVLAPDGPDAPPYDRERVGLYVDGYLARLEPALSGDVRALIQLVEHGGFLFRLQGSRFTHLSPEEQDAVLLDWQASRLAVRRQGFQALRTLAFLGYWRDDRAWPLIAYTGPTVRR